MSAHATKTKQGFSGFLRRLFHKADASDGGELHEYNDAHPAPAAEAHEPHFTSLPPVDAGGKYVQLPLRSVIAALPLELRSKVKKAAIGDVTIPVLQSKIL